MHYQLRKILPQLIPVGAISALQALVYLDNCRANKHPLPVLILMDLYLPRRTDSWSLLRQLRRHPDYSRIPVIIMSRSEDEEDQELSLALGALAYLVKPSITGDWECFTDRLCSYWKQFASLPPDHSC